MILTFCNLCLTVAFLVIVLVTAALDAAGCEKISIKSGDKPVAVVWHVFRPQDADRIRSFVDKVHILQHWHCGSGTEVVIVVVVECIDRIGMLHSIKK